MRRRLGLLLLGLLLALPVARGGERRSELLNFDWRFRLGEQSGAECPGCDDRRRDGLNDSINVLNRGNKSPRG